MTALRVMDPKRELQRIQGLPTRFEFWGIGSSPVSEEAKSLFRNPYRRRHLYEDDDEGHEAFWKTEYVDRWFGSWLLWGLTGRGKTGTAVAYARERQVGYVDEPDDELDRRGVRFVDVPDLMAQLRATYNAPKGIDLVESWMRYKAGQDEEDQTERGIIERLRSSGLLILDDLGAEHVKDLDWYRDRVYQVLGYRHAEQLDTVISTNLAPAALGQRLGDRLFWRIVEMCGEERIVHLQGPNLRNKRSLRIVGEEPS